MPSHHLPSSSTPTRACKVLVVDDEDNIRTVVCELLGEEGYPVTAAANGAEALARVATEHPCVVLLDMRMPVLDGWGFMRALQAQGHAPAVLVLTAAQNARQWAEEVQATGYVAKPFDVDELLAAVERLCADREAQRR